MRFISLKNIHVDIFLKKYPYTRKFKVLQN